MTRILINLFCCSVFLTAGEYDLVPVETSITGALEIYTVERPEADISGIYHVVRTSDKLLFCDSNLTVIKEREIVPDGRTKIHPSKFNRYFLLEEFVSLAEDRFEAGLRRWTLIDYRGTQYYSEDEQLGYDYFTTKKTVISDVDGTMYELETSTAEFTIRSRYGEQLKRIKLYDDFGYWYAGLPGYIDISTDGSTVAVAMNHRQFIPERQTKPRIPLRGKDAGKEIPGRFIKGQSGEPHIFVFDRNGVLKFDRSLVNESTMKLSITSNSQYIFSSSYTSHPHRGIRRTTTTIYDANGVSRFDFDFSFWEYLMTDDKLLVFRRKERQLVAIDLITGRVDWEADLNARNVDRIEILDQHRVLVILNNGRDADFRIEGCRISFIDRTTGSITETVIIGNLPKGAGALHSSQFFPLFAEGRIFSLKQKN